MPAAAAICGVDADVPAPSMSTIAEQLISAHGAFGVNAAIAVAILLSGPQFPCIVLNGRPRTGLRFAITPQAAMTRRNRAG